ncbi:MAG: response regulator [Elusimicrobia bacterium]|nr:response regulator [Elusimicrobiota bacterium]
MVKNVLIVDDTEKNIKLLEAFLAPEGYNILRAVTGEECLEVLKKNRVDMILLDVLLPGKSGFEVCREIKNNPKIRYLPVVMVTSLQEKEDRIKGIEAGADDFLSKPIDQNEVKARVKSLLRVKTLHDRLEKSYLDIKKLEQLKEDLSRMLVHDMHNILTSISINLELIAENKSIAPEIAEDLMFAHAASDELIQMASNLLDIGKMEEDKLHLNREKLDIVELISRCVEALKYHMKVENKEIIKDIESGSLFLEADRSILGRVVTNLLTNSLKYSMAGGNVTIRAGHPVSGGRADDLHVEISIADQGAGIPGEYHEKIFDKYEQIEAKKKGVRRGKGLGLYFCKMAVISHGGRIWVESEPGKGSVFKILLPVKGEDERS